VWVVANCVVMALNVAGVIPKADQTLAGIAATTAEFAVVRLASIPFSRAGHAGRFPVQVAARFVVVTPAA
jgi:hypothetical protein